MILDELTLHNFGVYGGRQSISLTPTHPERPIILFGGLNGGGKTTLVDALQLCLYGQTARCSNRNGFAYDEFLRRSVHRRAMAPEAAIEVAFRHTTNGKEQAFRLHRSWTVTSSGCREHFHVLRDGHLDKLATENWTEQVEDFIPARIAHLFLFDGEKVEGYADLDGAPALIATAIQNLLGLDIVERLTADLAVLERRKKTETKAPDQGGAIEALRANIARLSDERRQIIGERAAAANIFDRRTAELVALEERYRREGGTLFERRSELEADAIANDRELATARKELRELAAAASPLLLVRELISAVAARDALEETGRRSRETLAAIVEEHQAFLSLPMVARLPAGQRATLHRVLETRRQARRSAADRVCHLDLSAEGRLLLGSLMTTGLSSAVDQIKDALEHEEESAIALDHSKTALAASPTYDVIAHLLSAREAALAEVARLQSEQNERAADIERLDRELGQLLDEEARIAETSARARFEHEDVQRVITHATRVRTTLGRFRDAVVERHVSRIQRLVLDSFHQLIRKRSLVSDLRIDPRTFMLELRGADGRSMTPDRLSAGERQLLAIAILWGLSKASGRPLPTVIDTPMGRLDSQHRVHLVRRYFPQASHQVLLLSTDEEIIGRYYEALRPSIDRAYHLRFDESEGRTVIELGYLAQREHVHGH